MEAAAWPRLSCGACVQERTLHRRLGLRLVTSSTAMLQHPKKRSMREIVEYADAMGVNIHDAEQAQRDALTVEELPAMRVGACC